MSTCPPIADLEVELSVAALAATRYKQQRDQLLQAVEEHRAEKAHGRTANMDLLDDRLYKLADQIKNKGTDTPSQPDALSVADQSSSGGETRNPYVRSTVVEAAIERLEEREKEAAERLAEHRAERDPMCTSRGSLLRYTEKRIYRDAILVLADADYERHVLTSPGVAEAIEAACGSDQVDGAAPEQTSCPVCGQPVEVHHGGEGTSYYLPVDEDSRGETEA